MWLLLKCPWCGDGINLRDRRREMECPGCGKSFAVRENVVDLPYRTAIPEFGPDYKTIGLFHPSRRSREEFARSEQELDNVLAPYGIVYSLDGSRVYEIIVAKAQAEEARDLLKAADLKICKLTPCARNARWRESWFIRLVQWTSRLPFLLVLWWCSRRHAAHQHR